MNAIKINNVESAVQFLTESARYFENRPINGEDRAYWANVFNAENCLVIADMLKELENDN